MRGPGTWAATCLRREHCNESLEYSIEAVAERAFIRDSSADRFKPAVSHDVQDTARVEPRALQSYTRCKTPSVTLIHWCNELHPRNQVISHLLDAVLRQGGGGKKRTCLVSCAIIEQLHMLLFHRIPPCMIGHQV